MLGIIETLNYGVGHPRESKQRGDDEGISSKGSGPIAPSDGLIERYIKGHMNIAFRRTQGASASTDSLWKRGQSDGIRRPAAAASPSIRICPARTRLRY